METQYKFKQISDDGTVTVTSDAVAWTALADRFLDFLLASGFILTRQDLSDHFLDPFLRAVADERESLTDNHADSYGLTSDE